MSRSSKQRRIIIRLSRHKAPTTRNQTKAASRAERPSGENTQQAPHWFVRLLFGVYVLAIIWTSLAYAVEHGFAASATAASGAPWRGRSVSGSPLYVPAYVQNAAKAAGVDPSVAEWIVSNESQHHPDATGDRGESRGIWQINRVYHPEVSDACAYDVQCSTDWSLRRIRDGYVDEWTTWKYCHAWFDDCPF